MSDIQFDPTWQVARKRFGCDHCVTPILPGQRYFRLRGIWDGDPGVFRAHQECEYAAQQWLDYHDCMSDEGCLLSADIEPEDWGWLLVDFPAVAERLGIAGWARPEFPLMVIS